MNTEQQPPHYHNPGNTPSKNSEGVSQTNGLPSSKGEVMTPQSIASLLTDMRTQLFSFAKNYTSLSEDDKEDAFTNTYIALVTSLQGTNPIQDGLGVYTYVRTTFANKLKKIHNQNKRQQRRMQPLYGPEIETLDPSPSPPDQAVENEYRELQPLLSAIFHKSVLNAYGQMDRRKRTALTLVDLKDKPQAEALAIMQEKKIDQFRMLVCRSREQLTKLTQKNLELILTSNL